MKVPLLNFVGGAGIPLLNFEGGPGVPLLNFSGVPGPGVLVPLLHHARFNKSKSNSVRVRENSHGVKKVRREIGEIKPSLHE